MTDEEFIEEMSDVIGDIGLEIWRFRCPDRTDLFTTGDLNGSQLYTKNRIKRMAAQVIKLAMES